MPRQRQFDEQDLMHKSMMLFWQKGYANTSLKDIEKALGLTPPSIYNAFGNKLSLFEKIVRFYTSEVVKQRIEAHLSNSQQPLKGLEDFFLSVVENCDEQNPGMGCLLTNTSTEPEQVSETLSGLIKQGLNLIKAAMLKQLELAQQQGEIQQQVDLDKLANNLLLAYQGLLVVVRLGLDQQTLQQQAKSCTGSLDPYLV